jgi:hypothetical protein
MQDSPSRKCVVLFPTDSARTFAEIMEHEFPCDEGKCVDIIVIDGTWQQARRTHSTRYIVSEQQGGPLQAKLSDDCIARLGQAQVSGVVSNRGHQLRKHSVIWKQVATLEATHSTRSPGFSC